VRRTGIAIALVLFLCGAQHAVAKSPTRIVGVSESAPVGAQPVSIEPICPGGTKAIGGGFSSFSVGTTDPSTGQAMLVATAIVYESRRASSRAWRTSAVVLRNPSAPSDLPGPGPVGAVSYCKRVKGKVREVAAEGPRSNSTAAPSIASARCPKGQARLSGGFSALPVPGPQFQYPSIYESAPVGDRAWRVAASPGTQPSASATSYVYCVKTTDAPVVRKRTRAAAIVNSRSCPKGLQVGAGGFRVPPGGGVGFSTAGLDTGKRRIFPGVAYPTDDVWTVTGGAGPGSQVTAFGICS
jgi:hypothetical protein